ncbi:Glycosyltransferase involved in cell wall bisynthesis [Clostridium cavendishii DSM 21758]|uniref:Glycosyltransferase involved in cell wall bisynthesis n=1 Tax=Clostridium cavendishii DSM 21758 TaxID=1121302 RepID=A0A1M6EYF3_9CLOT|nr:glycosyltransferase [Clostridium cavendishii]SHI90452.1 Glycosyltransferase involved in cell wall bisynthesis [Clostridium cavendishii DSM 21758]
MSFKRTKNLVSVVISNFNNAPYLEDCLNALLNQTYKNIEIIIVDDCSTDDSKSVINMWIIKNEAKFPNKNFITTVNLSRNVGFSGAVTCGLFHAHGEFIAIHDSDDISDINRIKKQVDYLKKHSELDAVGCNYSTFTNDNPNPTPVNNGLYYGVDNIKEIYARGGNAVCYGTLLFKAEIFDNIGGLTRKINGAEDYEFITKLLPFGIDNINESLYYYRNHDKQRSNEFYSKKTFKNLQNTDLKVLLALDTLNIGGTETHVLSLAKELIKSNVNVVILSNEGPLSQEFQKLNCKIYTIKFPLTIINDYNENISYKNKIKEIVVKENINIIHAHQSPSGAICIDVAKDLRIPSIFTVHGLYYHDIVSTKLPLCSKVISVSTPVYNWLSKFNIQSTIIPNGINFDDYSFNNKNSIRSSLEIPENALLALYCSRLAWEKTKVCENLIRVCKDLRITEKIDVHAIILGDGPDLNKIREMADFVNNMLRIKFIHVLGSKTNVSDYYNACNCVIGTGRVAIEAIASYKPVIASGNHGYLGILNKSNIDNAWKVYFGDHDSWKINNASFLYNDLITIYQNKKDIIYNSKFNIEWAKNIFSISKVTEDIINIYKTSLQNF